MQEKANVNNSILHIQDTKLIPHEERLCNNPCLFSKLVEQLSIYVYRLVNLGTSFRLYEA